MAHFASTSHWSGMPLPSGAKRLPEDEFTPGGGPI